MAEFEVALLHQITKRSLMSGQEHTMTLLLTPSQWEEIQPFLDPSLPKGRHIQGYPPRPHGRRTRVSHLGHNTPGMGRTYACS
jgi:hypothetical protein